MKRFWIAVAFLGLLSIPAVSLARSASSDCCTPGAACCTGHGPCCHHAR